ncbi:aromatic ring hydroxylase [archaeon]|nr:aromatic ring hydroxylase [archaeon]|tara:strand:- start:1406 stop:1693 length:288 start_codon:yes stop_codon:yes gene_type:complete
MIEKEQVIEYLKQVQDPELNIDVWTLGLIYDIKIAEDALNIQMTFTTPMCPYGPTLVESIKMKLLSLEKINQVDVEVVFDPPWQPNDELRAMLGV